MYESYFQLRERPFALTPDPDYLYPSRVHREALDYLRYGIETHAGFVLITGEIGSGKTTLLQSLLRGLDGQTTVVRLMNTLLEPRELLEAIAIDLGIVPSGTSKPALLRDLSVRLVEERAAGRLVLLVIDEAQNLGLPALEEIRMLSNLETEKSKLLQIVLVGQPDLRQQLDLPRLEQLRQRITVSYHLNALDAGETESYINHRLRRASLGTPLQFPRTVTDRVFERSKGVPRLINVICDATLVYAYAEDRRAIEPELMADVFAELEATGVLRPTAAASGSAIPTGPAPLPASVDAAPAPQPEAAGAVSPRRDPAEDQRLREQQALLQQREEQLARREQQLGEQQRVLAEEYRLFRARQARELTRASVEAGRRPARSWPPAVAAASASAVPGRPPGAQPLMTRAAGGAARVRAYPPGEAARWPHPRRGFWWRVKEAVLGRPIDAVEDR
ncbi:MAG TPA: AAA family ATPase [Vicinamibacterales bacterium]|nr:AAA family ATPase [Vicinamibacterales bacterium]